jgi:hypothetical protein
VAQLDQSDRDQIADPNTDNLLKNIVSPVALNLPSVGKVDVFCNNNERPTLIRWLHKRSIGCVECIDSSAVTIYDFQNLGLSKSNLKLAVRKDRWEERKAELEQFIICHHWPIRPVGNTISVQLPADDISSEQVKTIVMDLLQADLLDIYQCRCHSSDFQLIARLPASFNQNQYQSYLTLVIWLSTETKYYYQIEE